MFNSLVCVNGKKIMEIKMLVSSIVSAQDIDPDGKTKKWRWEIRRDKRTVDIHFL